jgi:hypothetical protein
LIVVLFDVKFAQGARFAATNAAWKWVFPNAEKVGIGFQPFAD